MLKMLIFISFSEFFPYSFNASSYAYLDLLGAFGRYSGLERRILS
jgi:hypothetical protein